MKICEVFLEDGIYCPNHFDVPVSKLISRTRWEDSTVFREPPVWEEIVRTAQSWPCPAQPAPHLSHDRTPTALILALVGGDPFWYGEF